MEGRHQSFLLLRAAPGVCPICAVDHDPEQPHNKESLYYQMRHHAEHGVWPTWEDACAHCAPDVRDAWRQALAEMGVG